MNNCKIQIPMIKGTFPPFALRHLYGMEPRKPILITRTDWETKARVNNQITGVIESDGLITIHWRTKTLKKRLTQEEWNQRYFIDNL